MTLFRLAMFLGTALSLWHSWNDFINIFYMNISFIEMKWSSLRHWYLNLFSKQMWNPTYEIEKSELIKMVGAGMPLSLSCPNSHKPTLTKQPEVARASQISNHVIESSNPLTPFFIMSKWSQYYYISDSWSNC